MTCRMPFVIAVLLLLSACGKPASNTASGPTAAFKVDQVGFEMVLPKSYCPPTDQQAQIVSVLSASDTRNVTHLSLFPCGAPLLTAVGDYTLVKTPIEAVGKPIGRAALLEGLGSAFDSPEFSKLLQSGAIIREAADSINRAVPAGLKLDGALRPLGRDDTCAYLGGVLDVSGPNGQYRQAVGVCITSVGDRAISINRYGSKTGSEDVLKLLGEAKAIVATITPVAG